MKIYRKRFLSFENPQLTDMIDLKAVHAWAGDTKGFGFSMESGEHLKCYDEEKDLDVRRAQLREIQEAWIEARKRK